MKLLLLTCAVCALVFGATQIGAEDMQDAFVEQTTESPIADMALVDPKDDMMDSDKETKKKSQVEAQPHTVADFIIHPLIALKPRQPEAEPAAQGKQAEATTTPSPWQFFGFNPGQNLGLGLGSQVSNLAGQVSGWLGNRIQLPGLVDTPVRESSSTSTTSTTPRPDIVVRVQQRQPTRKPLIAINNDNNDRPLRNKKKPNRINNNLDDFDEYTDDEYDDIDDDDEDFDDGHNNKRGHDVDDFSLEEEDDEESHDDEDDDESVEHDDAGEEDDEDEAPVKPANNRRRRPRPLNHNNNNQRRRFSNNFNGNQNRRRPQDIEDVEQYDDEDYDQGNFYNNGNNNQKRSQNQQNFIQRGQQSLMNQIRQFTRGQTPAEIGNVMRNPQNAGLNKKRRQQATLLINRNGQTIYVAPELLQATGTLGNNLKPTVNNQQYQFFQPASVNNQQRQRPVSPYPQPPLTVPYRRKGEPTQYITIPWGKLGISPPDQIVSLTDGIQSQPLILNIPQSAINAMQNQRPNHKQQLITSDAVPLLADASLMDVFKPPRIPPARTPAKVKPTKKPINSGSPVVIANKPKPGPQRIRPGTIVEKAPADDNMNDDDDSSSNSETLDSSQFIVVGEDGEAGLARNSLSYYNSLVDYLQHNGAFRDGRQLNVATEAETAKHPQGEQQIPVQIITAAEDKVDNKVDIVEAPVATKVESVETPVDAKVETIESPVEAKSETTEEAKVEPASESKVVETKVETPVAAKVETADVILPSHSE